MTLKKLSRRALEIKKQFRRREKKKWRKKDLMLGMIGDIGSLAKLVLAQEGMRTIPNSKEKLRHELSDCLWSLLVLSHEYNIDLDKAFMETMNEIEKKLK